ncbi:hypothetical protein M422DRAFT_52568 [Sphaerobolus stellatus SS14]|uniref:Transcription activator GCR1-like domain-containing protein n=1 Tax=Sphaerobolus stellatus (strain SS14) TaxID=990650 RepID=A0A0C9TS77_SPHS4|nr:hypothetical protein M422DRAFT_52568 [Sphaerobolus stellatus SS14]
MKISGSTPSLTINILNSPGASVSAPDSLHCITQSQDSSSSSVSPQTSKLSLPSYGSGIHTSPSPSLPPTTSSSHLSMEDQDQRTQMWYALFSHYEPSHILAHNWEYLEQAGKRAWVPNYNLQDIRSFRDIWIEWSEGMNGFLPLCVLHENFKKPAWHRSNKNMMTNVGRWLHFINTMEKLIQKLHWDAKKALNFITQTYNMQTPNKFCRWLAEGKGKNLDIVLEVATKFH